MVKSFVNGLRQKNDKRMKVKSNIYLYEVCINAESFAKKQGWWVKLGDFHMQSPSPNSRLIYCCGQIRNQLGMYLFVVLLAIVVGGT